MPSDASAILAVEQLRSQFVRNSATRLDHIDRALDVLRAGADAATLEDLLRRFHGLAGLGATFGFSGVTDAARRAEKSINNRVQSKSAPSDDELAEWSGIAQDIRRQLEVPGSAALTLPDARQHGLTDFDVILVEDEPEARELAVRVLESQGLSVRPAAGRSEALHLLSERKPDALVTDVLLPDGSGYDIIEALRKTSGGDTVPAVITSSLHGFIDRVEGIRSGADAFFEKPLDWSEVVQTLDALLERTRTDPARVLVLTADEEPFAASVLESAGYSVRICPVARHLAADLAAWSPDVVVVDPRGIDIPTDQLTRYIRQRRDLAMLPVIGVGMTDRAEQLAAIEAGADDVLVDVDPRLLLTTVSARIERSRFVRALLDRDGLTGLLTHGALIRQMSLLLEEQSRYPQRRPSLVLIDLDRFKNVNDRFGHLAGDRVLGALGALLRRRLRKSDLVGRYGGEEFAIVFSDLPKPDAARLADRLREEFRAEPHQDESGHTFQTTFSAGVASLEKGETLSEWIGAADAALYRAKESGRDQVLIG